MYKAIRTVQNFMERLKTIVQTIHYLLSHIQQSDKKKIIKLLFLADKHHLQLYSRTITDDNYVAMKHGPVGSIAKDILDLSMDYLDKDQIEYAESFLQRVGDLDYIAKSKCDYEMLSETDEQSLNFIVDKFGKMDSDMLEAITHQYPEWARHEPDLKAEITKCRPIDTEEMFSTVEAYPLNVSEKHIKRSQEIYSGCF